MQGGSIYTSFFVRSCGVLWERECVRARVRVCARVCVRVRVRVRVRVC